MNPIVRKSMSTLVIQPSFRALGQMQVKWQTFENQKIRDKCMVRSPPKPDYHTELLGTLRIMGETTALMFPVSAPAVVSCGNCLCCHFQVVCIVFAALIMYFFSVSLAWMLVEGVQLYLRVTSIRQKKQKILLYYAFAWGKNPSVITYIEPFE